MKRASWKGYFVDNNVLKFVKNKMSQPIVSMENEGDEKISSSMYVRIKSRNSAIPRFCLTKGIQAGIYNGKEFKTLSFKSKDEDENSDELDFKKENLLGYKFGEFSFTRKHSVSSKRKKKEKSRKKTQAKKVKKAVKSVK